MEIFSQVPTERAGQPVRECSQDWALFGLGRQMGSSGYRQSLGSPGNRAVRLLLKGQLCFPEVAGEGSLPLPANFSSHLAPKALASESQL